MAKAATRPDHAQDDFNTACRHGGISLNPTRTIAARNGIPATAAGAGIRAHLQVHFVAANSGTNFSRAGQAFGADHRVAG